MDLNHAFDWFELDKESKDLFDFYSSDGKLLRFNRLVTGTSSASHKCHECIRHIVEMFKGVQRIHDDLVVHGAGNNHNMRLEALFRRFQMFHITLKKKCQLGVPQVKRFGNIYSK